MSTPLMEAKDLSKTFTLRGRMEGEARIVRAVDGVSMTIDRGETFGLVGESGSGKTTLGRTVVRLYEPSAGQILFDGTDIAPLKKKALTPFTSRMQTIFQDPYSSLNPYMNVEQLVGEPLRLHRKLSKAEQHETIREMLHSVGLNDEDMEKYPHEFSGGQRQRIGVARALITEPDFVLCDEPISALDVSIQAQIVNLLEDLQDRMGLTYLFVAHDLSMVRHISRRIGVMYMGRLVEVSPADALYEHPLHPYTKALLSAIPIPNPIKAREAERVPLHGDPPSPTREIPGCAFAARCPIARPDCTERRPTLETYAEGHTAACFYVE